MTLIELQDIRKTYTVGEQKIHALDGISLSIEKGEYAAIVGPSGSGKSTLMHLLGCLDTPTSGVFKLNGLDVSGANSDQLSEIRNREIGFVFQSFNLLMRLNVLQNVELPMIYGGLSSVQRKERAVKAIERVGLSERIRNRPLQLSGGQCQRVAIARAIVNNPSIILADEPTGNLDSKTGKSIMALFEELVDAGSTVILVTHDPAVAACARFVIEIRDGRATTSRNYGGSQ